MGIKGITFLGMDDEISIMSGYGWRSVWNSHSEYDFNVRIRAGYVANLKIDLKFVMKYSLLRNH